MLCRGWVTDNHVKMGDVSALFMELRQFMPKIHDFYDHPSKANLYEAYDVISMQNKYLYTYDLDTDGYDWYYIGTKLPFIVSMIIIELLIFLLIIPKVFFYIVL